MRQIKVISLVVFSLIIFVSLIIQAGNSYDLGGRTVSYTGIFFRENIIPDNRIKRVEKDYNIDFQINKIPVYRYPSPDYIEEILSGIKENKPEYSILHLDYNHFLQIIDDNPFHSLSDILNNAYFDDIPDIFNPIIKRVTINGEVYALPFPVQNPISRGLVMIWNKEIFEKENLPDLIELQENGDWTWEEMTQIAKKVTGDTTGDNNIDQWGLGGRSFEVELFHMLDTYDAPITKKTNEDIVKFAMSDERTLEALEYIYTWHNEKELIYPNSNQSEEQFKEGNIAMLAGTFNRISEIFKEDKNKYGLIYFPKGQQSNDYVVPVSDVSISAFSVTERDPEILFQIYQELFPPEDVYRIIDNDSEVFSEQSNNLKIYKEMTKNWRIANMFGSPIFVNAVNGTESALEKIMLKLNKIITGQQRPEKAMKDISSEVQRILDEVVNKN